MTKYIFILDSFSNEAYCLGTSNLFEELLKQTHFKSQAHTLSYTDEKGKLLLTDINCLFPKKLLEDLQPLFRNEVLGVYLNLNSRPFFFCAASEKDFIFKELKNRSKSALLTTPCVLGKKFEVICPVKGRILLATAFTSLSNPLDYKKMTDTICLIFREKIICKSIQLYLDQPIDALVPKTFSEDGLELIVSDTQYFF